LAHGFRGSDPYLILVRVLIRQGYDRGAADASPCPIRDRQIGDEQAHPGVGARMMRHPAQRHSSAFAMSPDLPTGTYRPGPSTLHTR
jgi:hypothetical protein